MTRRGNGVIEVIITILVRKIAHGTNLQAIATGQLHMMLQSLEMVLTVGTDALEMMLVAVRSKVLLERSVAAAAAVVVVVVVVPARMGLQRKMTVAEAVEWTPTADMGIMVRVDLVLMTAARVSGHDHLLPAVVRKK